MRPAPRPSCRLEDPTNAPLRPPSGLDPLQDLMARIVGCDSLANESLAGEIDFGDQVYVALEIDLDAGAEFIAEHCPGLARDSYCEFKHILSR